MSAKIKLPICTFWSASFCRKRSSNISQPAIITHRQLSRLCLREFACCGCQITSQIAILLKCDFVQYRFRRHTDRRGRSPSPGPDVGAAACWKMRSAACSPGYVLQSGTTQGLVYQVAYGGPRTIKTGWTAPSLPACLPAYHPGACRVTLTTKPKWGKLHPTSGQRRRQYG